MNVLMKVLVMLPVQLTFFFFKVNVQEIHVVSALLIPALPNSKQVWEMGQYVGCLQKQRFLQSLSLQEIAKPELKLMNDIESEGCLKQQVFNLKVSVFYTTSSASALQRKGACSSPSCCSRTRFPLQELPAQAAVSTRGGLFLPAEDGQLSKSINLLPGSTSFTIIIFQLRNHNMLKTILHSFSLASGFEIVGLYSGQTVSSLSATV